jgi:hypothetical protein
MTTVKLSYSILSAWANKQYEQAVAGYLRRDFPITKQIELGRAYDELWTKYIDKYKKLPDDLGGITLNNPVTQFKKEIIVPLGKDYQILLRGIPDCVDDEYIREFKCGLTPVSSYINQMQLPYYKLLYPEKTIGIYYCYNPYAKKLEIGVKYLTEQTIDEAIEHIITFGSEMIDYLKVNKLLVNYTGERL